MGVKTGNSLSAGDLVAWIAPDGMTTGRVVKVITSSEWIGEPGRLGQRIRGSEEVPYFLVEAELGGAHAAYRRESLTRL
jgi:hypothetical protein